MSPGTPHRTLMLLSRLQGGLSQPWTHPLRLSQGPIAQRTAGDANERGGTHSYSFAWDHLISKCSSLGWLVCTLFVYFLLVRKTLKLFPLPSSPVWILTPGEPELGSVEKVQQSEC